MADILHTDITMFDPEGFQSLRVKGSVHVLTRSPQGLEIELYSTVSEWQGRPCWRFKFPAFHLSEQSQPLAACHLLGFVDRSLKLDTLMSFLENPAHFSIPPVTDPLLLFLNTSYQHKCEVVVDWAEHTLQGLPPPHSLFSNNSQADL